MNVEPLRTVSPLRSQMPAPVAVPASFFGIVLGLAGLATAWRDATALWPVVPPVIGDTLRLVTTVVWAILIIAFADKWLRARAVALAEWRHPVQSNFIGLAAIATMLVAMAWREPAPRAAELLFAVAALAQLGFAVMRMGDYWQGGRSAETATPALYLPTVAGNYVTAIGLGAFGFSSWGQLFLGAGIFSWLAIEPVLVGRFLSSPMAPGIRPILGIQLAPAAVGAVAYLAVVPGTPGPMIQAMLGYAILQALILLRLLPSVWRSAGFGAGFWAYSFGATALASAAISYTARGGTGALSALAPVLLTFATLTVLGLTIGTLIRLGQRRLLPARIEPVPPPPTLVTDVAPQRRRTAR
jgi:tellurite resistance protein